MKPKPFIVIGPGNILQRNLEALNWTNRDLAEILGMSEKSISLLLNNKQSVTIQTARLLAKTFKTSPEFWLNLEQNYRLRVETGGQKEAETEVKAEIRTRMPILEMKKKGWISCDRSTDSQEAAYKAFWNQEYMDFSVYEADKRYFYPRQGKDDGHFTRYYSITWFHKAQTEAARISVSSYDRKALLDLTRRLPHFTRENDGPSSFLTALGACGVKFFVLDHLAKTYLDGASFLDAGNPVIVYTARYDRIDNFWWTLGHELAHVLLHLHGPADRFLDDLDERSGGDARELEADAFAAGLFKVDDLLTAAKPYASYLTEVRLKEIATIAGISPQVALGILKYHKVVDYRTLPKLRHTVRDLIGPAYDKNRR